MQQCFFHNLSTGGYSRASCSSPKLAKVLLRVLDDLAMCCNELELAAVSRFKLRLNEAVVDVFRLMLLISKTVDEKEFTSYGMFWSSMFRKLQVNETEFDRLPQRTLKWEADLFNTFCRELNVDCQECPSNNILNALTSKCTLYYLQRVARETLEFTTKMQRFIFSALYQGFSRMAVNDYPFCWTSVASYKSNI